MSEYNRNRNYNILENYKVLNSLGKYLNKDKYGIFRYHSLNVYYALVHSSNSVRIGNIQSYRLFFTHA
jgi:hypothetical protein